ncbi:hypothetical protein D9V84_09590 [Bacteroidetes/Chlorobi group bacterium Naka2016]|jgi:hypothetical protein|nr:MAG: hypothetical protein D9V84_09590 [Bacteroidetes/Chlorobi group bacterium Naka2016]
MGIDKFINEYLDGNLSHEEDKQFRDLIENDPTAREEFDLMMSIYSILKDDAESIAVPKNLEEKVEERILASYLKVVSINSQSRTRRFAYALVAFLIMFYFSIYEINDSKLANNNSYFLSEVLKQQEILQNQFQAFENIENASSTKIAQIKSKPSDVAGNETIENSNAKPTISFSSSQFEQKDNPLISNTNIDKANSIVFYRNGKSELVERASFSTRSLLSGYVSMPEVKFAHIGRIGNVPNFLDDVPTKGISLTSFSSFPLKKFGFDEIKVNSYSSFSQSVGYKIMGNFQFGIEFGYFDYDYQHTTKILVPALQNEATKIKIYDKNIKDKSYDAVVLTNSEENPYPRYVEVSVPIQRKNQYYWGSVFMAYEAPLAKYLSLVGKLNIGATNDGFLAGLAVYTKIEPAYGITLNFGLDNKSYWGSLPKDRNTLKSIFGLIYGVSINFDLSGNN